MSWLRREDALLIVFTWRCGWHEDRHLVQTVHRIRYLLLIDIVKKLPGTGKEGQPSKETSGSSCESVKPHPHTTLWRNNNCGHHIRNNEDYPKKLRLKNDLGDVSLFQETAAIPKLLKHMKINPYEECFFHSLWGQDMNSPLTSFGFQDKQSRSRPSNKAWVQWTCSPFCQGYSPSLSQPDAAHALSNSPSKTWLKRCYPQEGALRTSNSFCYQRCRSHLLLP